MRARAARQPSVLRLRASSSITRPSAAPPIQTHKLVFIAWSDDNAPVKPKMLYASSKDAIKKSLNGVQEEYQATERGDLDEEEVNKKAGGNK